MKALIKLGLSILVTAVAFIPLWIFLIAQNLLSPEGFWQKLVLYGAGIYLLGFTQVILLITWIIVLVAIWTDSY